MPSIASTFYSERLLTGALTGTSPVLGPGKLYGKQYHKFLAKFKAGSTQGVVTIERAADPNDTDTWESVGTITWTGAANKTISLAVDNSPELALRARITTTVDGGGVTVDYVGV